MKMLFLIALGFLYPTTVVAETGLWEVTEKTSAIDGAHNYTASVTSDDEVSNVIGHPEKPFFGVDCGKNGLFVAFAWPDFIQTERPGSKVVVVYKADEAAAVTEEWTSGLQFVSRRGPDALRWLNAISTVNKITVRLPDRHGGQEASFQLGGIGDIVAKLNGMSCG